MRPFFGPFNQKFATNYNQTFNNIQAEIFSNILNTSHGDASQCPPENTSECQPCGACNQCGGVIHPWDHASNEYLGPYYWETEAEAESAADDVVGFCEELQSAMAANGYCGATVNVSTPRVYQWTAYFFDPPQTLWSLTPDFAEVTAGCCGTQEGVQIGPKWPNTNFQNINDYPFGSINPCV